MLPDNGNVKLFYILPEQVPMNRYRYFFKSPR